MHTDQDHPVDPGDNYLKGFVEETDYAKIRGSSLRTCQRDRHLRISPPYVKIGRRVFYRVEAIQAWLISRERSAPDSRAPGQRATPRHTGGKS
jgi:hypothetical protein